MKTKNMKKSMGEECEIEYAEDMQDVYATEVFKALDSAINAIKDDLEYIVNIWFGHYSFSFATLTPGHLEDLYRSCNQVKYDISGFFEMVHRFLGSENKDIRGWTVSDYEYDLLQHEFELELIKIIQNSFILSSGNGDTLNEIIDPSHFEYYQQLLLHSVVVEPWCMPEFPEVVAPERPSVILKVTSLSNSGSYVTAGLDDVFCTEPLVKGLFVDEDVKVGDHIIVKTSGWTGMGKKLDNPEYDGLAESNCPCSDASDILAAKYDFDPEREKIAQKNTWFNNHFLQKTSCEILECGRNALNDVSNALHGYNSNSFERQDITGHLMSTLLDC